MWRTICVLNLSQIYNFRLVIAVISHMEKKRNRFRGSDHAVIFIRQTIKIKSKFNTVLHYSNLNLNLHTYHTLDIPKPYMHQKILTI